MSQNTPLLYISPKRTSPLVKEKSRKLRICNVWQTDASFESESEAKAYILTKGNFGFYYGGVKTQNKVFRCTNVLSRAEVQCDQKFRIILPSKNETQFKVEWNKNHHSCGFSEEKKKNALNEESKEYIESLYSAGIRGPKKMVSCLIRQKREGKLDFDELPKIHQIKYFLSKIRDVKVGPAVLSLGELERWCLKNASCPTDAAQPFVIAYKACYGDAEIDDEQEKRFWYLVSSKTLMDLASQSNVLCADSTYKLLKDGFAVPLFGTVDANKQFKPLFIGVSSNETRIAYREMFDAMKLITEKHCKSPLDPDVLVADGSMEIRGGFDDVFPGKKKVMCWAHAAKNMRLALDKYVKNKKINGNIFADIHKLQLAQSDEIFYKAAQLFCQKYIEQESFVKYFESEWVVKRSGWHEGVSHHCPSTNNAQEATHRVIKLIQTMRRLKSMQEMKKLLFDIVFEWSEIIATQRFSEARKITNADYVEAYIWNKSNIMIMRDPEDNEDGLQQNWFVTKNASDVITDEMITESKTLCWETFDDFKVINFRLYSITTVKEDSSSFCDCINFFKNYKCVHSLGMAVRLGYVIVDENNKETAINQMKSMVSIGKKNKRGRPKLAGKPLLMD